MDASTNKMAGTLGPKTLFPGHQYSPTGHNSGRAYLSDVREVLKARKVDQRLRCDQPTEALGNCFPYAIMQQLNRAEVKSSLSDEMVILSQNYHTLRTSLVDFLKNIGPSSGCYWSVMESKENFRLSGGNWDESLNRIGKNRAWFTNVFVTYMA